LTILNPATFPLQGRQLIEASAGTGKTYTITSLCLRLLIGPEARSINQILVLTFTIAATDELRQRIRERVRLARQIFYGQEGDDEFIHYLMEKSNDIDRDKKLLSIALQMMDEAAIYTIHGFCARVLSEQSFETGMLFDQKLDGDKDQLQIMAAEDCFRRTILNLDSFTLPLALSKWSTPERLLADFKPYLARFDLNITPPPKENKEAFRALLEEIEACKKIWLEDDIETLVRDCEFKKGSKTVRRLGEMTAYATSDSLMISVWEHWSTDALAKATKKTDTTQLTHSIFERINLIWEARGIVEQESYNLWHLILQSLRENLNHYKEQFSLFTMDDLLSGVHQALINSNGNQGRRLAQTLRERWPIALIDEFQDTDELQYEIFSQIYTEDSDEKNGLFFIGDPKQAIYQFRGADIYTYISAKRKIGRNEKVDHGIFTLDTNWRSSETMIDAINHLFQQKAIFGNDEDIPYEPVQGSPTNRGKSFTLDKETLPPVQIYSLPPISKNKNLMQQNSINYAAEETLLLLQAASKGAALINGKPLVAGQIAFLVRNHSHATMVKHALAERGIGSVQLSRVSVLSSDTADDLRYILNAALEPKNERCIKSALATELLQFSVSQLDAIQFDQNHLTAFITLHEIWRDQGIAGMINHLIEYWKLGESWLPQIEGERQLTNLRHLGEILQDESQRLGMHRLVSWFNRSGDTPKEEEQLRIESDQHLVQIVTMHAAKGLEYDIVMIPIGCYNRKNKNKSSPVIFHETNEKQIQTRLDLSAQDNHRQAEKAEELAEDMRLFYVAITRARYRCYLGLTQYDGFPSSAFAKLLGLTKIDEDLSELNHFPSALFEIKKLKEFTQSSFIDLSKATKLVAPPKTPRTSTPWRVHSYTGLTRAIQNREAEASSAPQLDELGIEELGIEESGFSDDDLEQSASMANQDFSRFNFPRGPRVGVALHDMLEFLDFQCDSEQIQLACRTLLTRVGLDENEHIQVTTEWVEDILKTPFSNTGQEFKLENIPQNKRLNELEFYFPVNLDNLFLEKIQEAGYLSGSQSIKQLEGMMTGYIDLIIQHKEKFYLIDYKSNDLGLGQEFYEAPYLDNAMKHHLYDLQFLIYCVALIRFLKKTIAEFSFDKHFGGACYLFLRGMSGKAGAGIYFDRPSESLLSDLDRLLSLSGDPE